MSAFRAKPVYPRVNRGDPLANGLVFFISPPREWGNTRDGEDGDFMYGADACDPYTRIEVSGHENRPTRGSEYGPAFWEDGNEDTYITNALTEDRFQLGDSPSFTKFAFFKYVSSGGNGLVFSRRGFGGPGDKRHAFTMDNSGVFYVQLDDDVTSTTRSYSSGIADGWHTAASCVSPTTIEFYIDGVMVSSQTNNTGTDIDSDTGREWEITGGSGESRLLITALWKRALTAGELQQLHHDPWRVVRAATDYSSLVQIPAVGGANNHDIRQTPRGLGRGVMRGAA